jgi:hypothetical protein
MCGSQEFLGGFAYDPTLPHRPPTLRPRPDRRVHFVGSVCGGMARVDGGLQ